MMILISLLMALIPGVMIIYALRRQGLIVKKQNRDLLFLFLLGTLSIFFACFFEDYGDEYLLSYFPETSLHYVFYDSFLITAFSEELGKLAVLLFAIKRLNRKNRYDAPINGCICGIFIGLGFGVLENLLYATDGDLFVMVFRALFCVPGHALYGLYMGYFIQKAIEGKKVFLNIFLSFFIPVIQHGLYDFSLGSENNAAIVWTFAYNLILYYFAVRYLIEITPARRNRYHASLEVLSASISCS